MHPETETCEEVCAEALRKYGLALWRVNNGGMGRASWKAWLRGWLVGEKGEEDEAKVRAPLTRLGGEVGGRGELI